MSFSKKSSIKMFVASLFIVSLVLFITGCPGTEESGEQNGAAGNNSGGEVNASTYKLVGALLSLTGEYYQYGSSIKDGIEMAEGAINSEGGVKGNNFTVIIEDSESTVEGAKRGLDRLIQNGVKVVIGPETSELCEELIPYAVEKKIVLISPSATAPSLREISAKSKGYFFRICATDDSEAVQLAIEMVRSSKWKFIKKSYKRALVIIRKGNAFTEGFWRAFGSELMQKGIDYKPVRFDAEQVVDFPENPDDYHPEIAEIVKEIKNYQKSHKDPKKEGAVVILAFAHEVEFFLRAFDKENLKLQVYTTSAVDTYEFMGNAADVAEGIVFPKMFDQYNVEDERASKLIFDYYEKKKRNPDLFVAYGYDAAMLLGLTMRREGIEEIINEPYTLRMNMNDVKYHGLTGTIDFNNSNNEVNKTPTLYILEENAVAIQIKEHEAKVLQKKMKSLR